ncbi:MAG: DUF1294 domain-containing protein [Oscillospiraceae bacterium]|nr:DUF1294 domain-containing protein [Oscillospiraceae bacterium]
MKLIIIGVILAINIIAFFMYGLDKSKAKSGAWRIPEATLLGIAFFGGALGAFLGMKVFRHKTKHVQFFVGVPVMLVLQIALAVFLVYKFWL